MTTARTDPRALDYDPGRVIGAWSAVTTSAARKRAAERLRVADVMSAPAPVVDAETPLLDVVHRLLDSGDEALVVTDGARPEGVITAREILRLLHREHAGWRPQRAIDLVPTGTPRLLPDLNVGTAVKALTGGGHEALPVVDYRGDLVGLLALRHLIGLLDRDGHAR